ncbi:MAG: protease complex subunit PrcB family protein [Gemmatimonadota bacterium]
MRRLRFAWLAGVLACASTTSAGHPSTSAAPTDLAVHRLQEWAPFANASGYDTAETAVIRSTGAWRAAWTRIHGGMTPLPLLPVIDFSRNVVVLVAVGTQSSGGHGLAITRATSNAGTVMVHAVHTTPGVGCGVTMELTQPVDVIRLETKAPTISFDVITTAGTPCPGGE